MTKSRRTQNWADDDDDDNRSIDGSRASAQEHFNETNLTRVKYFIQIINSSVFRRLHSDLKSGSWQVEIVSDVASSHCYCCFGESTFIPRQRRRRRRRHMTKSRCTKTGFCARLLSQQNNLSFSQLLSFFFQHLSVARPPTHPRLLACPSDVCVKPSQASFQFCCLASSKVRQAASQL